MNFDDIERLLGSDVVDEIEALIKSVYVRTEGHPDRRQALVELLLALVAALLLPHPDREAFLSLVDDTVERLRAICDAAYDQEPRLH